MNYPYQLVNALETIHTQEHFATISVVKLVRHLALRDYFGEDYGTQMLANNTNAVILVGGQAEDAWYEEIC